MLLSASSSKNEHHHPLFLVTDALCCVGRHSKAVLRLQPRIIIGILCVPGLEDLMPVNALLSIFQQDQTMIDRTSVIHLDDHPVCQALSIQAVAVHPQTEAVPFMPDTRRLNSPTRLDPD